MSGLWLIVRKELAGFRAGDTGAFVVYAVLVFAWSVLIALNMDTFAGAAGALWWVFLSVIISGNFGANVFVAERLSGSLEILLSSGLSRRSILGGKVLYVMIMTATLGGICYALALMWSAFVVGPHRGHVTTIPAVYHVSMYLAASYMNATCNAWLSLYLTNPRLSSFANLFVLALIVATHTVLAQLVGLSEWALPLTLVSAGLLFHGAASRAFSSERVTQPAGL